MGEEVDAPPAVRLAQAPGLRVGSALARVEPDPGPGRVEVRLGAWFEGESLAAAHVLGGAATTASDFRIDAAGHVRFAVMAGEGCGARRLGRIVQCLFEIEVHRSMPMLGPARAGARPGP